MQPFIFDSYLSHLSNTVLSLLIVGLLIVIVLKGYSLWYSARGDQKWWFLALMVTNTMGILEIVYLLFFSPKPLIDTIKSAMKKDSSDFESTK